jgi:hypothetical protein
MRFASFFIPAAFLVPFLPSMYLDEGANPSSEQTLGSTMHRAAFVELFERTPRTELQAKLCEASDSSPEDAAEAFDALGLEIAGRYHSGQLSFEDADYAANDMWSAMCHGRLFTDFFDQERAAARVYLAFDEGECRHPSDKDEVDPV